MSGRDLVRLLAARWWVVALVAALSFGVAVAALAARDDTYAARTSVVVRSEDPRLDLRLAYYSQELVRGNYNPYADYFAVLERSGGDTGSQAGAGELRTTTIVGNDEVIVELVGLAGTPREAAERAASAADGFVAWVSSGGGSPDPEAPAVLARIGEPARVPDAPAGPSIGVLALVVLVAAGALGVAGGLAAGAGAARMQSRSRSDDSS